MKRVILFSGIVIFMLLSGFSQTAGDTIYFDQSWNQTSKEEASYFRLVSIDTSRILFMVRDYYLNGQLQMEGAFRSINPDLKIGKFTYWYKDGSQHISCHFKDGKLDGRYEEWYENGSLKTEKNFTDGKLDGMETMWTDKGVLTKSVQYKNGARHGPFITYYSNGQPIRKDIYKNDKIIRGKCFTQQGKDTAYFEYFIMPGFKGGISGFKRFILEKLNYPDTAKQNDEEGSVHIRFTVGRDGYIKGIKLIKADKEYFNEEVIQAVASSPKWIPGKRDGKFVDVTITIPVRFRLK
jgi:TonB family protein